MDRLSAARRHNAALEASAKFVWFIRVLTRPILIAARQLSISRSAWQLTSKED
jgi:hypothetical protein